MQHNMTLTLPDYWLPRPSMDLDAPTMAAFDVLLAGAQAAGHAAPLDYPPAAPKWQFLCYAADRHRLALHGSGNPGIAEFEPRQSNDLSPFGNRKAVFAAADGIWPMYYAILDRDRYPMTLCNACLRFLEAGVERGLFYLFSITRSALAQHPWRTGWVYLLPPATFVAQPPMRQGEIEAQALQLASLEPVVPLARLMVGPEDFPFLAQIRGHDDERLADYAHAMETLGPWPDG
jgi:hypothetical protein